MIPTRVGRAILVMVPSVVLLYAYSTGPDPRVTGAPGDDPRACTACHNIPPSPLNSGGGNVRIDFANGQTYTPGAAQTFSIVITDAVAHVYGFQMTARLASDLTNGQAGDFTADAHQYVKCDNGDFKGANSVCSANAPVQFIEHNSPYQTNTISVQWTAPATDVGSVHLYIAANAANGDANFTGDHIYTADYVLTSQAASGGGGAPTIAAVQSAGGFNANAGLASGTWLEIFGTGLATTTRTWGGDDFKGSNAPTTVDGVSVTVNGIPAYVAFVSPGQVNVQAPDDSSIGPGMQVQVTNASVKSNTMPLTKSALAPALLAPGVFIVDGKQYVVAQFTDLTTYVGRTGLVAGLTFRPAKPGDTVVIYAIGCGPVTPATPAGTIAAGLTALQNTPTFRFGNATATVPYAGLVAGLVGLYQFNVVVPNVPPGDVALTADIGGVSANSGLFITVGQ
ncbi:MAG TPA: choice-of-anchor V domain-containing protein [Candidatus Solibacter sp.]|nr:choice-of-anchor V domain-containing protein [Candidatus Solibacter sp.]